MKAVRHPKHATAKLRTNSRGGNNGLPQATQEIMREQGVASQRCPSEVLSRIRQVYSISAATFGNGVSILIKATIVELVAIGGSCAAAPGPRVTVSKCNPLIEM